MYVLILAAMACAAPEPPATGPCAAPEECVLALDLAQCCGCPVAVLASSLDGRDDYAIYEEGRDYSDARTADCSGTVCAACVTAEASCSEDSACVTVPTDP